MKTLYLVDVSSMFFRAFYAIRQLSNPQGMPTNAIYGFLSMTTKLLRDCKPDAMAFCFDRPEPSFRKEIDARYKANRTEMPEEMVPQIPYLRKISHALGVACFDKLGYEADDVIGALTVFGRAHGYEVTIVSGDKDFAQLVQPGVMMYDTMKDVRLDSAGVLEKFGVRPDQMIDYLALVGDSSDNVPGVKGIGPKGAQKLLADFGTLDGIYASLDKIQSKSTRAKLEADRAEALLSKKLVTIVCDLPILENPADLKLQPIVREELHALLIELDFKTFAKNLLGDSIGGAAQSFADSMGSATGTGGSPFVRPAGAPVSAPVSSPGAASAAGVEISAGASLAKDSGGEESSGAQAATPPPALEFGAAEGPRVEHKRMDLAQLESWLQPGKSAWGFYSERGVAIAQGDVVAEVGGSIEELGHLLTGKHLLWNGYDLKEFFKRVGVGAGASSSASRSSSKTEAQRPHRPEAALQVEWDQMLAGYVVRAGPVAGASQLISLYLGAALPELPSWDQVYSANLRLEAALRKKIAAIQAEKTLFEIELPLVSVLLSMERAGVRIDRDVLTIQSADLAQGAAQLEKEIHLAAGGAFNVGSPKQLAQILFEKLKLPSSKKTKTGFSTDNDVLEKLADAHVLPKLVLAWREMTKLRSTYVDALPQLISPEDGRVHTTFNQALTSTGRLSSMNPNVQNIPIRTERGARIRKAFVASEGWSLITADYSQIELRILAHVANDQSLKRAFEAGHDVHAATASEVFQVALADVTPDMRRKAKAVNFGLAYGQGAFGLAETLRIPRSEATEIINRYFARFSGVKTYMTDVVEEATRVGYAVSVFGRRRYLDELFSKSPMVRKFGERAAINAPIQGAASDIIKMAMIKAFAATEGQMILQVHDELIYEAPASDAAAVGEALRKEMETAVKLDVPLKVNVGIGADWDAAHS